jgi:hypothetical protein
VPRYFLGAADDDYDWAYETTVDVTRRRLEAAGLSGELYPFDTMADRDPLRIVPPTDYLECLLTLPGRRVGVRWQAPQDAVDAFVDFAVGSCQWGNAAANVHITTSIFMGHTAGGELAQDLLELQVQHPHDRFNVTAVDYDGRFRRAVFAVEFGSIALVVGTRGQPVSAWRDAVQEPRDAMVAVAPNLVSGVIKRGPPDRGGPNHTYPAGRLGSDPARAQPALQGRTVGR